MSNPKLTEISGVGPATARILAESGFPTVESIARATEQELAQAPGLGEARAKTVIAAAKSLLSAADTPDAGKSPKRSKKDKESKKGKDKGKGKKKKKDKKGKKGKKKKDRKGKKKSKK